MTSSLNHLFAACQADFPASLPPDSWYLVVASALLSLTDPNNVGVFYKYLTGPLPQAERRIMNRRLREFAMKQWVTIGIPKTAVAMHSVAAVEETGDAQVEPLKKFRTIDPTVRARGDAFLAAIYGTEAAPQVYPPNDNDDWTWLSRNVIYGLFYADDGILGFLETEMITFTAIVCSQPLALPMVNHLTGLRRLGLDKEQCFGITRVAERVAEWAGVSTNQWKSIEDVVNWSEAL